MRTMAIAGSVLFLLGALFLIGLGLFLRSSGSIWMYIMPTFGVYFMARGACHLGTALES